MTKAVLKTLVGCIGACALLCSLACSDDPEPAAPAPGMTQPMAGAPGAQTMQAGQAGMADQAMTDQAAATSPCPNYMGDVMGMPIDLPGCCMPEGVCGVVSSISMMCITSSMYLPDLAPGGPCTP
ncbi:MAG: hypothetical protein OXU20_40975 [Myxococcales bacterium]|nr:hypothetical protein [Myxococcales bacterium]MDD9970980.1 hypothetical protein [Myxococcales bacterium]